MKKLISILLLLIIIIMTMSPIYTYASVVTETTNAHLLQEGDYSTVNVSQLSNNYSQSTLDGVKNAIYDGLNSYSDKISVYSYKISTDDIDLIYSNVINDNPDLFYVSSNISYNYIPSSGAVYYITPQYVMTSNEIDEAKIIFNNGVNKILSLVDASMSDVQKALVIHDAVCNMATYPDLQAQYDSDNNFIGYANNQTIYHSAYGLFYDGNIVCAGYALVYSYLLNKLDIPSKYIISDNKCHAWNAIYVGKAWYNVDVTFDDPVYSGYSGCNLLGVSFHEYFLKSNEQLFSIDSVRSDARYPDDITCDSTNYDSYFWDKIKNNICVYNSNYYYIKTYTGSSEFNLCCRTKSGDEEIINESKYNDSNASSFTKLAINNETLYFNYRNSSYSRIAAFDLKKDIEYNSIYEFKSLIIWGLCFFDNNLTYSLYGSKNEYTTISFLDEFKNVYTDSTVNPYLDKNGDGVINAKDYAIFSHMV